MTRKETVQHEKKAVRELTELEQYEAKIAQLKADHVAEAQAALDEAKLWEPAGVVIP